VLCGRCCCAAPRSPLFGSVRWAVSISK
ncbi:hypothetical protein V3C99_014470, partial [Haemonchus contortus]